MTKNILKYSILKVVLLSTLFILFQCQKAKDSHESFINKLNLPFQEYSVKDSIQIELDEIYTLLAYSFVLKDWQSDSTPRENRRGYNIGTVLINANNDVVNWALNCVNSTNSTQHGEVRAITSFLEKTGNYNLSNYTLYTTLEPCAMCAGMMIMTSVNRVVYGQHDVEFSQAMNRLALNSKGVGGYDPYPRTVISDPSPSFYRKALDSAYANFLKSEDEKYLAKFLTTDKAWALYERANSDFMNYKTKFPENREKYERAKAFYLIQSP